MDHYWKLCNANYHQMVQVMIQLVKNLSFLRIDTPEWHPRDILHKSEENACEQELEEVGLKDRNMPGKSCVTRNIKREKEESYDEAWKMPKRGYKKKKFINKINENTNSNRHAMLTEENDNNGDESLQSHDQINEMIREI